MRHDDMIWHDPDFSFWQKSCLDELNITSFVARVFQSVQFPEIYFFGLQCGNLSSIWETSVMIFVWYGCTGVCLWCLNILGALRFDVWMNFIFWTYIRFSYHLTLLFTPASAGFKLSEGEGKLICCAVVSAELYGLLLMFERLGNARFLFPGSDNLDRIEFGGSMLLT